MCFEASGTASCEIVVGRTLVALAALAMAGAGSAAAPSPETLLARHLPVVVLHPAERFQPVPVDGFLADSDVQRRQPDGTWATVTGALPTTAGPWRLDQRLCRTQFAQVHEGDWELVTILLDRAGRPLTAGYSRHCGSSRRPWANVPKRGLRPVVYVALGSHANYVRPGAFPHDKACWPEQAVIVFKNYGKPLRDFTAAGRTVSPRLARVTAGTPSWMRFPGRWGEDQIVFFPQATFTFGTGPTGPAFKRAWKEPIGAPLGWPRG